MLVYICPTPEKKIIIYEHLIPEIQICVLIQHITSLHWLIAYGWGILPPSRLCQAQNTMPHSKQFTIWVSNWGSNYIFPKCNEMGELVWTDVLCQWLPLLTHKNSNLMLWIEGARMPPFSFENNFHWNSHHYCVYLAKFWYEWLIKWAPLFCFGPNFSRSILKIVKLQAVFWDQVH